MPQQRLPEGIADGHTDVRYGYLDYGEKSRAEAPDARSVSVGASAQRPKAGMPAMPVADPRLAQDRL